MDPRLEFQRQQVLHGLHLLDTPLLPQLEEVCRRVQERFDVPVVIVTVMERERQIVKARVGTEFAGSPRPDAFCDHLIRLDASDEVLVVPDARRLLDTEPRDLSAHDRADLVDLADEVMMLILEGRWTA